MNVLVKYLPHGLPDRPVMFVRRGDRCGYAWGYKKREAGAVPATDLREEEKGVTWHANFYDALVAWAVDRNKRNGGAIERGRPNPNARRPVRQPRPVRSGAGQAV